MINILVKPLELIMNVCYSMCNNYVIAIIIFTLISKILLLPVSIWVQKNSIKMVKMQPELNDVKFRFFGDREKIADQETEIYKKYKYNPLVSVIPMLFQFILLIGVIEVIKNGLNNTEINNVFCGVKLDYVSYKVGGFYFVFPLLAGISSLFLCICQNKSNVLQAETSKVSRIITLIISVGLSFYLGFFVTVGVVIYWIFSNLFAIALLYILNFFINPKKYVDYIKLEESRKALDSLNKIKISGKDSRFTTKELLLREKKDYKKFFSVINKHLVFYSESSGFYKYYERLINYLLNNSKLTIHYITSDPTDIIFELASKEPRIRPYYIGEKRLITLMMRMDADIVAMTMPDLGNYHIKRSYIRKDIEYLYIQHGIGSVNLLLRKGALDNFDTVFCCGATQKNEIIAMEKYNKSKHKRLIETGYFLLDDMMEAYEKKQTKNKNKKTVMIAPSWQDGNIINSCIDEMLFLLSEKEFDVIVRPHPQHVRHEKDKLELLKSKYEEHSNIKFQLDFSDSNTVWNADLLITDWSDIATEYAFCTKRPVLFINTPMKIMNEEWKKIDVVPLNIKIRDVIGKNINPDQISEIVSTINSLFDDKENYRLKIEDCMSKEIYNLGTSAEIGGIYIIDQIKRIIESKNNKFQN